jgi:hypothetical protein
MREDAPLQKLDMLAMQTDLTWLTPEQIEIAKKIIATNRFPQSEIIKEVILPNRDQIYDVLQRQPEDKPLRERRALKIIAFCVVQGLAMQEKRR